MDVCGNVFVSTNYEQFTLKCLSCPTEIDIAKWQEFVLHFRNSHSAFDKIWPDAFKDEYEPEQLDIQISENFEEEPLTEILAKPEFSDDFSNEMTESKLISDDDDDDDDTAENDINVKYESTTKFNPTFYRRNSRTTTFINLYKARPCLWDTENANYRNEDHRKEAFTFLINEMLKQGVSMNHRSLETAIRRLHEQYESVEKKVAKGDQKLNSVVMSRYNSCQFLKRSLDPAQKEIQKKQSKDSDQLLEECSIKLTFTNKNDVTTRLIDLYSRFPQLYDPKHKDFAVISLRKKAYQIIVSEFRKQSEAVGDFDIITAILYLRQWYYKTAKSIRKPMSDNLSDSEMFYLQKCQFLPPNTLKLRLPCEFCQKPFHSEFALQAHLCKEHGIGELPYKCSLCDRNFEMRTELITHRQRVHIGKVYKCPQCERSFAVSGDLKLHSRTHTGSKPYVCEICGKAFRIKAQLNNHTIAIHTKVRAFKCTMCPKDFLKNRDLKDHIKAHLNIRDKICETCGKGFTNCHSLIRHRQIHAEIKKFACKLCDSRFSQFVGLNSHMKRTHNILPKSAKEGQSMA